MDNVPEGMRSAAGANADKERSDRRERSIPEQHNSTDPAWTHPKANPLKPTPVRQVHNHESVH